MSLLTTGIVIPTTMEDLVAEMECPHCKHPQVKVRPGMKCKNPRCRKEAPVLLDSFPCPSCGHRHSFVGTAEVFQIFDASPACEKCGEDVWPTLHEEYEVNFRLLGKEAPLDDTERALSSLLVILEAARGGREYADLVHWLGFGPDGAIKQHHFDRYLEEAWTHPEMLLGSRGPRQETKDDFAPSAESSLDGKLRQALERYFNLGELANLCHDLGWKVENFNDTLSGRARDMITYAHRYGQFDRLVTMFRQHRPHANLSFLDESDGGGAIAQGPGATAVGKGGVFIGGSVSGDIRTGN